MKNLAFLSIAFVMIMGLTACNAQTDKKEMANQTSGNVEAYYFHFSTRCVTCKTVETEAQTALEMLYKGEVAFQSINLDDETSKALAEKLQISGQTLLLVKGDTKINITNEGFMYARSNPEKFKAIIKEKVDRLLKL